MNPNFEPTQPTPARTETPETDAVNLGTRDDLLVHAKQLERQRNALTRERDELREEVENLRAEVAALNERLAKVRHIDDGITQADELCRVQEQEDREDPEGAKLRTQKFNAMFARIVAPDAHAEIQRLTAQSAELRRALEWAMNTPVLRQEPRLITGQNDSYFKGWHHARAALATSAASGGEREGE